MEKDKKLITVAEAAKILNRSTSTIYAALNASPPRLQYHDVRRRLLLREGLEARFNRSTALGLIAPGLWHQSPTPTRRSSTRSEPMGGS